MKDKITLPEKHSRSLSVMAHHIETGLLEIKKILLNNDEFLLTENVLKAIDSKKAGQILSLIDEMLKANGEMFFALELESTKNTDVRIIKSRISYLWSVIVDHSSEKMIRYGQLDLHEAQLVDKHVMRLLNIVDKIQSIPLS